MHIVFGIDQPHQHFSRQTFLISNTNGFNTNRGKLVGRNHMFYGKVGFIHNTLDDMLMALHLLQMFKSNRNRSRTMIARKIHCKSGGSGLVARSICNKTEWVVVLCPNGESNIPKFKSYYHAKTTPKPAWWGWSMHRFESEINVERTLANRFLSNSNGL